MIKQRLIVLLDGTWNDPVDQTNVYRVSRLIHDYDGDIRQRFFYDPGVGTSKWDHLRGGVFGYGLSENLRQGYEWLAKHYSDGDEIWIFGFSRGAYTARSLIGLIRKCGLLHVVTPNLLDKAENLYRDKAISPDHPRCVEFRNNYSHQPKIHFIGVWDTVGALGIPGTLLSEKGTYAWHDTELSNIVERAYHAIALDEHRAAYDVALWTSANGEKKPGNIDVEQRWFIGAHADVGGGYGQDPLSDISLQWMVSRAAMAGLKLDEFKAEDTAWQSPPTDSYQQFLNGAYAWICNITSSGSGRHFRRYAQGNGGLPAINVTVDESVWMRWGEPKLEYKPPTLTNAGQHPPQS